MKKSIFGLGITILAIATGASCGALRALADDGSAAEPASGSATAPADAGSGTGSGSGTGRDHMRGPHLKFDNDKSNAALAKVHDLLGNIHKQISSQCGPSIQLHDQVRMQMKALHEDKTLDRAAKRAKRKEIFASFKEKLDADRAGVKDCFEKNAAKIDPLKKSAESLVSACFGDARPHHHMPFMGMNSERGFRRGFAEPEGPGEAGSDGPGDPDGEAEDHGDGSMHHHRGHGPRCHGSEMSDEKKAKLETSLLSDACSNMQTQVATSLGATKL